MKPKHFLYLELLIAALMVAACGPTTTPGPTAITEVPTPVPSVTEGPVPSATEGPVPSVTEGPVPTKVEGPTASEGEVPMGFTEEGAPYRGNPNAPVTLMEYSDFQ